MTFYTIKTSETEADQILKGDKRFIIRDRRSYFSKGDHITFLAVKDGKPISHKVGIKTYEVTDVYDHMSAPIEKGYKLISFKEIA